MEEIREVRIEIPRKSEEISSSMRQISIEIPEDLELSEEEMKRVGSAAINEVIDIISGEQAKRMRTTTVTEVVKINTKVVKGVDK
jgi:hypothetical protein